MENSNHPRTRLKPLMPLQPPFEAGFCFKPTCQELILYLYRKVCRLPYDEHIIRDCDIYGDEEGMHEPWNLLDASDNTGEYFYVFTHLKKFSTNCNKSKKIQRKAGSGTWVGNASTVVKNYEGKVIGVNKYYKFELKEGGVEVDRRTRSKHGEWTMHEFSLPHKQSPGDVVLCVIGCNSTISVTDDAESSTIFDKQFCSGRIQPIKGNVNPTSVVAVAGLSANLALASNDRSLKSEERIMQGENQHILRKSTFEQQADLGSLTTVVQQRLSSAYGVEDQQNSRKRAHVSSDNFSSVFTHSGFSDQQQTLSGAVMEAVEEPLAATYPVENFRKQQAMPLSSYDHTMQQPYFSGFEDAFHSATANCYQNPDLLQMFHDIGMLESSLGQHATQPLFFHDSLQTQQLPCVPGYLDESNPQPYQPQVDPVAEEGHQQFNDVMDDIEKTAASRGIPLEDYLDELLNNI